MNVMINGHLILGGLDWVLGTTSGNVALFISLTLALIGAWPWGEKP